MAAFGNFLRKDELATKLRVSPRSLDRWHTLRVGPPRTVVGRTILYSEQAVSDWLASREERGAFLPLRKCANSQITFRQPNPI
jgi:hypothetical protein